MMTPKLDIRLWHALYTDAHFEALFLALDTLHDAAADGRLGNVTALTPDEVIGWLKDIAYTARETIQELETDRLADCPPAASVPTRIDQHGDTL